MTRTLREQLPPTATVVDDLVDYEHALEYDELFVNVARVADEEMVEVLREDTIGPIGPIDPVAEDYRYFVGL